MLNHAVFMTFSAQGSKYLKVLMGGWEWKAEFRLIIYVDGFVGLCYNILYCILFSCPMVSSPRCGWWDHSQPGCRFMESLRSKGSKIDCKSDKIL